MTMIMRILLQRYSEHFVITHPMAIGSAESDHGSDEGGQLKLPQIMVHQNMFRGDSMLEVAPGAGHRYVSSSVMTRPYSFVTYPPGNGGSLDKILQISKIGMSDRKEKTFL